MLSPFKAKDFVVTSYFDIKRIALFSGICEIAIIKQNVIYDATLRTLSRILRCFLNTFLKVTAHFHSDFIFFLSFLKFFFPLLHWRVSSHFFPPLILPINIKLWSRLSEAIGCFPKARKIVRNQMGTRIQVCWVCSHVNKMITPGCKEQPRSCTGKAQALSVAEFGQID